MANLLMKLMQSDQETGDLPHRLTHPARRALTGAGVSSLEQLACFSEAEIKQLHGIGPIAMKHLQHAMKEKGLSFTN